MCTHFAFKSSYVLWPSAILYLHELDKQQNYSEINKAEQQQQQYMHT